MLGQLRDVFPLSGMTLIAVRSARETSESFAVVRGTSENDPELVFGTPDTLVTG